MKKKYFLIMLILTFFIFSGCHDFLESSCEKEKIEFLLPGDFPEQMADNSNSFDYWKIEISSENTNETFTLSFDASSFFYECDKKSIVSVLAYPHIKNDDEKTFSLKPYGTIFPYNYKLNNIEGFASYLLKEFYKHAKIAGNSEEDIKAFAQRFNWEKLIQSLNQKNEKNENYNPWNLDTAKIMENFQNKRFYASFLNE